MGNEGHKVLQVSKVIYKHAQARKQFADQFQLRLYSGMVQADLRYFGSLNSYWLRLKCLTRAI